MSASRRRISSQTMAQWRQPGEIAAAALAALFSAWRS
jgi:hypothetical protein